MFSCHIGSPMMNFIKGKLIKQADFYLLEISADCIVPLGAKLPQ
jgi:hypothetical protein